MNNIGTIKSVGEYLNLLENNLYHKKEDEKWLFRGQASDNLVLRPKIGRYQYNLPPSSAHETGVATELFTKMFNQFKREFAFYHNFKSDREIDKLTVAQHYGLATPLLDWTLNPLVALYFACKDNTAEDGIIFMLNSFLSHEIKNDNDLDSELKWQILRPQRIDQRMINQDTIFTYHNNPIEDFSETLVKPVDMGNLAIIKIPQNIKGLIKIQLAGINIDHAFVFPGLDSICKEIDEAYKHEYSFTQDKDSNFFKHYELNKYETYKDIRESYN